MTTYGKPAVAVAAAAAKLYLEMHYARLQALGKPLNWTNHATRDVAKLGM